MKKYLAASLLLCLISACSSAEDREQRLEAKVTAQCTKLGLEPGTAEFDDCRLRVREAEQAKADERSSSFDSLQHIQSGHSRQW